MDHLLKKNALVDKKKLALVKTNSDVEFGQIIKTLNEEKQEQDKKKIANIKAKVLTIARFNRMLKNAKENSESLTKLKSRSNDGKLPKDILLKNEEEIKSDINHFLALKKLDSDNEKFPIMAFKKRESLKNVIPKQAQQKK